MWTEITEARFEVLLNATGVGCLAAGSIKGGRYAEYGDGGEILIRKERYRVRGGTTKFFAWQAPTVSTQKPQQVYVVCNNDAMLSATLNEQAAINEVARLKAAQADERFYYHYHEVSMLGSN